MSRSRPLPREPIRPLPAGRYRAVVDSTPRGAKRKQVTRTFTSLADARRWVTQVRAEVAKAGTYKAAPVETVDQLVERWLTRDDVRPITVAGYRSALAPVRRRLGHRKVASLTVRDARELTEWLTHEGGRRGGPLSPRSVRASLGALAQALDLAAAEGSVTTNVVRSPAVRPPRATRQEPAHWTPEQLRTFVSAGDSDPWAAIWRLVACGMTRADVAGLRWTDVDFDRGEVHVRQGRVQLGNGSVTDEPKSPARTRVVPCELVWPGTIDALKALRGRQLVGLTLVAVDNAGQPVRPALISERFARLTRQAGLPPIRLHATRHSLAGVMDELRLPVAWRAAFLGHSITVHHASYVPRGGDAGIQAVGEGLGQALGRIAL